MFEDVDQLPVFGLKVKSHTDNPFNDHVDVRAKWGAGVLPAYPCPSPRAIKSDDALRQASSLARAHSARFAEPIEPPELAEIGIDAAQSALVEVGQSIIAHLKKFVGPKSPSRPHISVHTLHLLAARDIAWRQDDTDQ